MSLFVMFIDYVPDVKRHFKVSKPILLAIVERLTETDSHKKSSVLQATFTFKVREVFRK